jgi:hypothetical protein
MKFNKKFKEYTDIFLEGVIPQDHLAIKQGDQVTVRKDWKKNPEVQNLINTTTAERLDVLAGNLPDPANKDTPDPIIATSISSKTPAAYGSFGSFRDNGGVNEGDFTVTIGQQYAIGLYNNIVSVPMSILQRVDNGINLTPLGKSQQEKPRKQTTGEEPTIDKNLSDPTTQTHASWKDKGGKLPS